MLLIRYFITLGFKEEVSWLLTRHWGGRRDWRFPQGSPGKTEFFRTHLVLTEGDWVLDGRKDWNSEEKYTQQEKMQRHQQKAGEMASLKSSIK